MGETTATVAKSRRLTGDAAPSCPDREVAKSLEELIAIAVPVGVSFHGKVKNATLLRSSAPPLLLAVALALTPTVRSIGAEADTGFDTAQPPPVGVETLPPLPEPWSFMNPEGAPPADDAPPWAALWLQTSFLEEPESMTATSEEAPSGAPEGPYERWRCLTITNDFTEPAWHPSHGGQIPVSLSLPLFDDVTLTATLDHWTWNWDHSVSWIGRTVESPRGSVVITVVEGKTSGIIRHLGETYLVMPSPTCGHVVIDIGHPTSEVPECAADGEEEPESLMAAPPESEEAALAPELTSQSFAMSSLAPSPTGDRVAIDTLVVYTDLARIWAGGSFSDPADNAGIRGWSANAIHEFDLILLRSQVREFQPRLVGTVATGSLHDPGFGWTLADCGFNCPMDDSLRELRTAPSLLALRDAYAADLIVGLLSREYEVAGVAGQQLGQPCDDHDGAAMSSTSTTSVLRYTFQHEFGHLFGVNHDKWTANPSPQNPLIPDAPGDVLSYGYQSRVSGYINWRLVRPAEPTIEYQYFDLMASTRDPRAAATGLPGPITTRAAACRVPVFGRIADFGWVLSSSDPPCDQTTDFVNFGQGFYNPSLLPDESGNGVPLGPNLDTSSVSDPTFPFTARVTLDPLEEFVHGDAGDYLIRDFFEPDRPPYVEVSEYRPWNNGCNNDPSLVPEVALPLRVVGQNPYALTSGTVDVEWDLSAYADLALSFPSGSGPYDSSNPETSPYYLTLGTTWGASNLLAQWVNPYTTCTAGVGCATQLTLASPMQLTYGRLWTQHDAGRWSYSEFRFNAAGVVLDCAAEDPEYAPASHRAATCGGTCAWPVGTFPTTLACGLTSASTGPGGLATSVRWDLFEETPWDATTWGRRQDGTSFCCHWAGSPAVSLNAVHVTGSNQADTVRFSHLGATLHPSLRADTSRQLFAFADGGLDGDELVGPSHPTMYGRLRGEGGWDDLRTMNAFTDTNGGSGDDTIVLTGDPSAIATSVGPISADGGTGTDAIAITWTADLADPDGLSVTGGTSPDQICANNADFTASGNPTTTTTPEFLYLSSQAVAAPAAGAWTTNSTSTASRCGHTTWTGAPIGGTCTWDLTAPLPGDCDGWINP